MKFIFITQEDPFYVKIFFETFLKNYKDLKEVQGVIICKTMGKSTTKLVKQMYGFYGAIDFCRVGLRYTANKVAGLLLRNICMGKLFNIEHICRHYDIKVIHWDKNINDPDMIDMLSKMNLDLIISVAAPHIFKSAILGVPKWGCINIHNAKLPKYKGMLPNFWCMYHNEKSSAITIHTMDLEIDRGRLLLQREFEIKPEESLDQLIKRTKALGAIYLIEVLIAIRNDTVEFKVPDQIPSSYFSFPTSEEVKEFRFMGKRLL